MTAYTHKGAIHKIDADIVIARASGCNGWNVWQGDFVMLASSLRRAAIDLIAAGASAQRLSVYDADAGHFLSGTVAQLAREAV